MANPLLIAIPVTAYALWFALVFVPGMNNAPDIEDSV